MLNKSTQTAQPPAKSPRAGATLIGIVGAAVAALLMQAIPAVESGSRPQLKAYRDIAGVWTICDGDTENITPGMVETPAGCHVRLDTRLTRDFAPAVLKRAPALKGNEWPLAAATVFAFNVGVAGWNGSTAATRFAVGDFAGGCAALGPYFVVTDAKGKQTTVPGWIKAGGKVSQGLINRRTAERTLCLTGKLR
ncbi:glycoside hydrolase family protein [Sphingomonas sp. PAMC 26605]|uniref:glycoside hydrolase family protein n=1 Tax=Sphingomonas sp. PAMC 26605 TaxID=1112214 RepID=UPI00026CB0FE|nr:lysozyme [Sphingomonas sp. PAMC 26605]